MVKIIGDTLSCISPAYAAERGIGYVPQIVIFGEQSYRDDTEMDAKEFLRRLRASSSLPKTAAPPPALYTPLYREAVDAGETVLVIAPSAELSGTVRSATVAAQEDEFKDADIRVIDTRLMSSGLGAMLLQAQTWADEGLDADTIEAKVREMSARHRVYFLVDTLEYLFKGGRIGAAKALFGSLLQVKPILAVRNGLIEACESQRTHKRALARLKEIVLTDCPRGPEAHLSLMHGDAEDLAKQLAQEFAMLLDVPVESIPIYDVTPAILVHAGPGVIGIAYYVKE